MGNSFLSEVRGAADPRMLGWEHPSTCVQIPLAT